MLISNYFIFKILKMLGQEATICTEEEILMALLHFERYLRFS